MSAATATTNAELEKILLEHAYRGVYLQLALRAVLVVFLVLTLVFAPPMADLVLCLAVVAAYAAFAVAFAWWARAGGPGPAESIGLALFADLFVVAVLTLLTGIAASQSWTADILINGLFVLPLLAATQLRPGICAAVVVPTVVVFFAVSWITKEANEAPWASIALTTIAIAGVGAASIWLTAIQRSRVQTISSLVSHRTALLGEVMGIETKERQELSERLHDGALQLVLAARLDVDDLRDAPDPAAVDRVSEALVECARLLRATVSELHPAVLEAMGLANALAELSRTTQARGVSVELDTEDWPEGPTAADGLLFGTARELLSNVVKHAHAETAWVSLSWDGERAFLTIADDGRGFSESDRERSLGGGHIGLASHELRVVAAGGTLSVNPRSPSGTEIRVEVPLADEL